MLTALCADRALERRQAKAQRSNATKLDGDATMQRRNQNKKTGRSRFFIA
jgi:hypothetical protein